MQRYAIIKDGVVVNVVEYEQQPPTPPDGFEDGHFAVQADAVSIGWTYANNQFTNTDPPEPTLVSTAPSLTNMVLNDSEELAKLKQALGLT